MRPLPSFLCLLLLAAFLSAQDPPVIPTPSPDDVALLIADFQPSIIRFEPKERLLFLIGNVDVRIRDLHLRCDNLLAWLADGETPPSTLPAEGAPDDSVPAALGQISQRVREIYADGMVIFSQGEEWARAERLYMDFVHRRGLVIDATISFPITSREGQTQLTVRADELRFLAENRLQALGATATTCTFGHPHFHVGAGVLDIIREKPPASAVNDPQNPINYHIAASDPHLRVGGLPTLWVPDFVTDTNRQNGILGYIEDVRFTNTNRFGRNIGLTIGDDLHDSDGKLWGHWSVPLDWYSKRGFGGGFDLLYGDPSRDYRGRLITRYQRDHGEDEFFGEPPTKNRGRVNLQHRHQLPWELQLDLEVSLLSDRGYYPTFFEDQDKNEKPLENLLYLKRAFFNSYLTALYTIRFNDWETVREYQPEVRYDLLTEPLFEIGERPLYFSTTARVSKNRLEIDEDLDISPRGTWRADVDSLFEYPFGLGPFTVTPFAGLRYTFYEEDLFERRDRSRLGFQHGATLTLQAWKTFDAEGGIFGLDGLRHVIYPEVTFRNIVGVDPGRDELIPFDEVDDYDNLQVFEFSVRNLLQTIRHRKTGPAVENIVDFEAEIDYFPHPSRDHAGDPFGNLELDLIVRFSDALQLAADAEYDWYGDAFEVANIAAGYIPSRDLQTYVGFRHFADTYDAAFVQQNWRVDEKWMFTLESSYDFEEDRGLDHRLTLTRIDHDWVFELGLRADVGEDDYGITFSLQPRFLFDPILRPGLLSTEPRLLYLSSGLNH